MRVARTLGVAVLGAKGASAHVRGFVEALRSEGHGPVTSEEFPKPEPTCWPTTLNG